MKTGSEFEREFRRAIEKPITRRDFLKRALFLTIGGLPACADANPKDPFAAGFWEELIEGPRAPGLDPGPNTPLVRSIGDPKIVVYPAKDPLPSEAPLAVNAPIVIPNDVFMSLLQGRMVPVATARGMIVTDIEKPQYPRQGAYRGAILVIPSGDNRNNRQPNVQAYFATRRPLTPTEYGHAVPESLRQILDGGKSVTVSRSLLDKSPDIGPLKTDVQSVEFPIPFDFKKIPEEVFPIIIIPGADGKIGVLPTLNRVANDISWGSNFAQSAIDNPATTLQMLKTSVYLLENGPPAENTVFLTRRNLLIQLFSQHGTFTVDTNGNILDREKGIAIGNFDGIFPDVFFAATGRNQISIIVRYNDEKNRDKSFYIVVPLISDRQGLKDVKTQLEIGTVPKVGYLTPQRFLAVTGATINRGRLIVRLAINHEEITQAKMKFQFNITTSGTDILRAMFSRGNQTIGNRAFNSPLNSEVRTGPQSFNEIFLPGFGQSEAQTFVLVK